MKKDNSEKEITDISKKGTCGKGQFWIRTIWKNVILKRNDLKTDNSEKEKYENDDSGKENLKKEKYEQGKSEKGEMNRQNPKNDKIWKGKSAKGQCCKGDIWKRITLESKLWTIIILKRKIWKWWFWKGIIWKKTILNRGNKKKWK